MQINNLKLEIIKNEYELDKQEIVLKEIIKTSESIDLFFQNIIVNSKINSSTQFV